MKKVILRTKPIHLIVISAIGIAVFILMIFLPILFETNKDLSWRIIWYILVAIGIMVCLYYLFSFLEFAIIKNDTLIIKKIFFTLVELPLNKFKYVFIEKLPAQPHSRSPLINWVTLCLDENDRLIERQYGGKNKKDKSPWQIMATHKNIEILKQYFVIDDPENLLQE